MTTRRFVSPFEKLVLAVLGSFAASLGVAREAHACEPPSEEVVTLSSGTIATDGLLVGLVTCRDCTTEDLLVIDDQGNEIAGTFEHTDPALDPRLFAWRPSAALTLIDGFYSVKTKTALGGFRPTLFHVIAKNSAPLAVQPTLDRITFGQDEVVCEAPHPTSDGSCYSWGHGFARKTVQQADLYLSLTGNYANEYAYRVTWWADGGAKQSQMHYSVSAPGMAFEGAPSSVCYELAALPVTGGEEIDLGSECFKTDGLGTLGVADEVYGDLSELQYCAAPPEGYEEAWCDQLRDHCEGISDGAKEDVCAVFAESCPAAAGDETSKPDHAGDGGCSVVSTQASPVSGFGLAGLLMFGTALFARRRYIA